VPRGTERPLAGVALRFVNWFFVYSKTAGAPFPALWDTQRSPEESKARPHGLERVPLSSIST
jgi:hypothetical protein